ncbi:hypothetical protein B0A54_11575 [Friedmanniomyces endolithicus]|uniref:PHD-type domain-containing protein n=1 Tax=Friedmanniomyces endolithicus TaxID=329885 RepID=A0A4U0UM55_9PEZI|nr:hypothetical protein B0A54_11575 [Friedmanniomyces endolithicus]
MATISAVTHFRSVSRQPPSDPDIHATLSDFLNYTEHFPSHLTRALTLIEKQRLRTEEKVKLIHDTTTIYSIRPALADKPDAIRLRHAVSHALEEAERSCRMAVEEAKRMDDTCQREARRLDLVTEKLKTQPMPPSRDPTPEQTALTSPNLKRERRMSMRADDAKLDQVRKHYLTDKAATKLRGRKVMVPGEVLPPPDPNAPLDSISDWTSPRRSPPLEEPPVTEKKGTSRPRSRTPKVPKLDKDLNRLNQKPRGPRAPGQPGTNAHSAIAGISTSNALLALANPPEDASKGSRWLPWMKLTEWEMAKLRKRMKKNAIWVPSQTMVRRELKNLGRGAAGKEAAKHAAAEAGVAYVDEHHETDPTKIIVTGEETAQMNALLGPQIYLDDDDADAELINRGMRLNEAKKLKRLRMLDEQAQLQAQIAREQGDELPATTPAATDGKKRKREATPASTIATAGPIETPDPLSKAGPAPKKLKLSASITGPTTKVPLAPAGVSSSPRSTAVRHRRAATPSESQKPPLTLKTGKAVSEEPPNRRSTLRRGSNVSLPTSGLLTPPLRTSVSATSTTAKSTGASTRRSKRPAPGILAQTDDGDTKVGVSRRKAAPRKKAAGHSNNTGSAKATPSTTTTSTDHSALLPSPLTAAPEEFIDPNEPRYCVCGDVSWGTMIACEREDCDKEWFHLECVGLGELPPRRTKWYCPDCRKGRVGARGGSVGRDGLMVVRSGVR